MDKAKKLGTVKILTEKEFLKMVPKGKATVKKPNAEKVSKPTVAKKSASKESAKPASNDRANEEVKIGKQIWMAKNLDVAHFRNGDVIPEAKTVKDWEKAAKSKKAAWCYYDNNANNGKHLGKLYNWYAVNDSRGLAPKGWRIPTNEDWSVLEENLGGEKLTIRKLEKKELFNGIMNGARRKFNYVDSAFQGLGIQSIWWTANEFKDLFVLNEDSAYVFFLNGRGEILRSTFNKMDGVSVLCLK